MGTGPPVDRKPMKPRAVNFFEWDLLPGNHVDFGNLALRVIFRMIQQGVCLASRPSKNAQPAGMRMECSFEILKDTANE